MCTGRLQKLVRARSRSSRRTRRLTSKSCSPLYLTVLGFLTAPSGPGGSATLASPSLGNQAVFSNLSISLAARDSRTETR